MIHSLVGTLDEQAFLNHVPQVESCRAPSTNSRNPYLTSGTLTVGFLMC